MSTWIQQDETPRAYVIDVEAAEWTLATDGAGNLVNYGDMHLINLELSGPVNFLDADWEVTEAAEPPMGEDSPKRSFTFGTNRDFIDEEGTGEAIAFGIRKSPASRFNGGQLFASLLDVADPSWLQDNLGDWNEAKSWIGHRLVIAPEFVTDKDGNYVTRSTANGEIRTTETKVVGIDDQGVQVG